MKLSLEINTTRISFRFVGIAALIMGGLCMLSALFRRGFLLPGALLLGAGLALFGRKHQFLIRHEAGAVADQISKTLDMLGWRYDREHDIISVPAVGATIGLRPLGPATLLDFGFSGEVAQRQEYLIKTLVKFQRQT